MDSDTTFRHKTVSGAKPRLLASLLIRPWYFLDFHCLNACSILTGFSKERDGTVVDMKDLVKAIPWNDLKLVPDSLVFLLIALYTSILKVFSISPG